MPHADRIYVGNGRRPEVRVHGADGELRRIIRWKQELIPVTSELIEEQVRRSVPRSAPAGEVDRRLQRARSQPQPDSVPAYFHIEVDGAGRIWVEDHPIDSPRPRPWSVFDPFGRALGRVTLPEIPNARVVELRSVGRDHAVLWWIDDELGFAHLTLHPLETAESGT